MFMKLNIISTRFRPHFRDKGVPKIAPTTAPAGNNVVKIEVYIYELSQPKVALMFSVQEFKIDIPNA